MKRVTEEVYVSERKTKQTGHPKHVARFITTNTTEDFDKEAFSPVAELTVAKVVFLYDITK